MSGPDIGGDLQALAVIRRNVASVEAAILDGSWADLWFTRCPECPDNPLPDRLPIRDDGTAECPFHGVMYGPGDE